MLKFNKGEWSEPYCLLKIMADKKLFLCNSDLSRTGEHISVIGGNIANGVDYKICNNGVNIVCNGLNKNFSSRFINELLSAALEEIKKPQPRTFSIPAIEKFFYEIGAPSLKSKSTNKADCTVFVFDDILSSQELLKFSIKSFLAGSPTLVNASKATNFTYMVGLSNINFTDLKAKALIKRLNQKNISIQYSEMDSTTYETNLMLIDTQMPLIISEVLKIYFGSRVKYIADIIDVLKDSNPLNIDRTAVYESKIKDFLFFSAVGMFPNKKWDGVQDIDGGCIIVKEDGDISTFYIFRKKFLLNFREYLYKKCFFRHG